MKPSLSLESPYKFEKKEDGKVRLEKGDKSPLGLNLDSAT
jgi:hypothetical protein